MGNKNDGKCYRCWNADHIGRDPKCPARGQTCHKCQGKDHYAKMCHTKDSKMKQNVYSVDAHNDLAFSTNDVDMPERLTFCVGGVSMTMLIDSGATSNIMGENADYNKVTLLLCP